MDNLAHSLAGAALAQAGLKRWTGLGTATLVIGANLADIDVLGLLVGENLAWRRGWTHGPLGLLLLPPLLALGVLAFDRWQARRGKRPAGRLPVRFRWVLALAYIGALSHPLLDWLNAYGIRLLMPFSERWFYGDILFIVDPWLWIALALGVWLSLRRERRAKRGPGVPALVALLVVAAYGGAMAAAGRGAEAHVARDLAARGYGEPDRILAAPEVADPSRWRIVYELDGGYGIGEFRWLPGPRLTWERQAVPTNMDDPNIARAAEQDKTVADFLYWSRYPFATIGAVPDGTEVVIGDARYGDRPEDGPFTVRTVLAGSGEGAGHSPDPAPQPSEE